MTVHDEMVDFLRDLDTAEGDRILIGDQPEDVAFALACNVDLMQRFTGYYSGRQTGSDYLNRVTTPITLTPEDDAKLQALLNQTTYQVTMTCGCTYTTRELPAPAEEWECSVHDTIAILYVWTAM